MMLASLLAADGFGDRPWSVILVTALGFGAVYLLLPRPRALPRLAGAALAAAALLAAGVLLVWSRAADVETVLFYGFAGAAVVSGGALVLFHNPVHAALSFALVVLSTCGLFLLQAAPFLMAATVIVYAGAIVVTFLFVIMLAQQAGLASADRRSREPFFAAVAGFALLGALLYVLGRNYDSRPLEALVQQAEDAAEQGSAREINAALGGDAEDFLTHFERQAERVRGPIDRTQLHSEVRIDRAEWDGWAAAENVTAMKAALGRLTGHGRRVVRLYGAVQPHQPVAEAMSAASIPPSPGVPENVGPLGRTLFSDYLLAVELGGTLLLVATIGAIAISTRRAEVLR